MTRPATRTTSATTGRNTAPPATPLRLSPLIDPSCAPAVLPTAHCHLPPDQNENRTASSAWRMFAADVMVPNAFDRALVVHAESTFVRFIRLNTWATSSTRRSVLRRIDLLARTSSP